MSMLDIMYLFVSLLGQLLYCRRVRIITQSIEYIKQNISIGNIYLTILVNRYKSKKMMTMDSI